MSEELASGGGKKTTSEGEVLVCNLSDLTSNKGKAIDVHGRSVAVFYHNGEVFALDARCYHYGGPLDMGDIEDIGGVSCIVCPWHKYKISLAEGEGFYQPYDPEQPDKPPEWCSKGIKQRTHIVTIRNDQVFVTLSDLSQPMESDQYYEE